MTTYSFSHTEPYLLPQNIPTVSCLYKEGIAIGFSGGAIRIYRGTHLVTHIESYKMPTALEVCQLQLSTNQQPEEALAVAYADGTVCIYLDSGKLVSHTVVPFRPKGIDGSFQFQKLLVWGHSCELVLLGCPTDGESGKSSMVSWTLPDWPMPVPLFDDRLLVLYKNGETEQRRVIKDRAVVEKTMELKLFSAPPPQNHKTASLGHFHDTDMIVTIKRVGPVSWLVVQRNGWTLYRWEEEQLVNQISSGSTQVLTGVVTGSVNDECFGVIGQDGSIIWVHDSNVQPIDPVWQNEDRQVQQVVFQNDKKQLKGVVLTREGIEIFTAHTDKGPIAWEPESELLEKFKFGPKPICAVHENDVIVCEASKLRVYSLAQFLACENVTALEIDSDFTCIQSAAKGSHVVGGTSSGRLVTIEKKTKKIIHSVKLFASPVTRLYSYGQKIVATSSASTVSVVDLISGSQLTTIPGNNVEIVAIEWSQEGLSVEYENGELRSWNLSNGDEIYETEEGFALQEEQTSGYVMSGRNIHPMVLVKMDEFINSLTSCLDSGKAENEDDIELVKAMIGCLIPLPAHTKKWHHLVKMDDDKTHVRIGRMSRSEGGSFVSIAEKPERFTDAFTISVWILLVHLLQKTYDMHVESTGRLLSMLGEFTEIDHLSGFASLAVTSTSPYIRHSARSCLRELVREDSEDEVISQWKPLLASVSSEAIFSDTSLQALEILASMIISHEKNHNQKQRPTTDQNSLRGLAREVAESLQLHLTDNAPEEHRDAAIEFIGKGWSIWQKHFNPLNVLDALIRFLYHQGYTKKDRKSNALITLCQRCIHDIATQNITLLITALVTHLGSSDQPLDARVTSIRLLTNLVGSFSTKSQHQPQQPQLIQPHDLPTIIAAIVKTLDPSDPSLRETAPIAGTSIISESTQFLSTAMNKFPDYLAFHKQQQRLAIATNSGQSILGLVYDLRTGTVVATLGVEKDPTAILTKIKFSPDGRQIAGVLNDQKVGKWKLGTGFMSLLHSLTPNQTNPEESASALLPSIATGKSFQVSCTNFMHVLNLDY